MSTAVEIVRTPGVLHGKPRIEGTRIGVFTLGAAAEQGTSTEDLLEDYPNLNRGQVEAAIEYYEEHPELMGYIRTRKEAHKQAVVDQSRSPDTDS
jgi:uncharacterized protein (DUF433 family)